MSVEMFKIIVADEIGTTRECNDGSGMPDFELTPDVTVGIAENLSQWFHEEYQDVECTEEFARDYFHETYPEA